MAAIGSQPQGGPPIAVWNTYIWVDSADGAASKVRDAGGRVLTDPFDVQDAGRMAVCADPEGATFCVWQAKEHKGARIVNEPGSLNFNALNTRNTEAPSPSTARCSGGRRSTSGGGVRMWRLPGYGDFLEQRDPGLRQRMAETAAPRRASKTSSRRSIRFPTTSRGAARTGA